MSKGEEKYARFKFGAASWGTLTTMTRRDSVVIAGREALEALDRAEKGCRRPSILVGRRAAQCLNEVKEDHLQRINEKETPTLYKVGPSSGIEEVQ